MTPYLAPLIGRAAEILDSWSQAPEAFDHFDLWTKLMGLIKRSVDVDDGGESYTDLDKTALTYFL
jgi:hypothetical protein